MNKIFSLDEIQGMDRFFRMHLMNTISGLKPANLISTISADGITNLGVFNSVVHIGANPPYMGFIMRPLTVQRQTYENIKATGFFTINHIHTDFIEKAHQTSANYPAEVSEFEACGFTEVYSEGIRAPFVGESQIRIGLKYAEEHAIQANGTILIVGKVLEVQVPEAALAKTGHVELDTAGSTGVAGLDSYYSAKLEKRLSYARVKNGEGPGVTQ